MLFLETHKHKNTTIDAKYSPEMRFLALITLKLGLSKLVDRLTF